MRAEEVWRTTTFRLSLVFGILFALGTGALLTSVGLQTSAYLNRRVDGILRDEATALLRTPPERLNRSIDLALDLNGRINALAVFSPSHAPIHGDLRIWPSRLRVGGRPVEAPPIYGFPAYARFMAFDLPDGRILVVGRDVRLTRELRAIIAASLAWSGAAIVVLGAALGIGLSIRPLRRLGDMQRVAEDIAAGDLGRRMPVSGRGDELDVVAAAVNAMITDVDRLVREVKTATDTVAHDLRTPLTHVRAGLHRLQEAAAPDPLELQRLTVEVDQVLERFRALMRLSELESPARRSGFVQTDLSDIATRAVELYTPLAEDQHASLSLAIEATPRVHADPALLFEAVANLIDNALKFAGSGAHVRVIVRDAAGAPTLMVQDDGPGVLERERASLTGRLFRGEAARRFPGSGLGLSVVAAIVRLHRFSLDFQDAEPGLRVIVTCVPATRGERLLSRAMHP